MTDSGSDQNPPAPEADRGADAVGRPTGSLAEVEVDATDAVTSPGVSPAAPPPPKTPTITAHPTRPPHHPSTIGLLAATAFGSAVSMGGFLGVALGAWVMTGHEAPKAVADLGLNLPMLSFGTHAAAHEPAGQAAVDWFVPTLGNDPDFVAMVQKELEESTKTRLDLTAWQKRDAVRSLRARFAANGLPDVMIGIPFVESRLRTDLVSNMCAAGPWQFMPESAVNYGLEVDRCHLDDGSIFDPHTLKDTRYRPYVGPNGCKIEYCEVDERLDLAKSTAAAMRHLSENYNDPIISQQPRRSALAVMAYNNGIGGMHRLLRDTDGDPFSVVPACASGDCLVLGKEQARYTPWVVATAAYVACNASALAGPENGAAGETANGDSRWAELSDWSRSEMCRSLHEAGMAPAPITATQALAAAATSHKHGWKIGLGSLSVAGFGLESEGHALDEALAQALSEVPGVTVAVGVPGETAESLFDEGVDVVVTGEIGRRGNRMWIRLERWQPGKDEPVSSGGAFTVLDAGADPAEIEASDLLADALLRPVRDRQAEAIQALVESQEQQLSRCVPQFVQGLDEPLATVSLRIDDNGHPATVDVRPDALDDPQVADCIEHGLSSLTFPRELAGAGTTLQVGLEAPAVADEGAQ